MSLLELTVDNFRCVEHAALPLAPGLNLIWGGNGSGKTSLLEAIFLLGRGRSFRTRNSERLIRHGQAQLVVFGRAQSTSPGMPVGSDVAGIARALGVQVSRAGGTVARIAGSPADSLAELSRAFPVQVIEPGVHKLLEEGANRRRRWMDWAVFHVEPQFGEQWARYTRSLKQRNAALRTQPDQASAWDGELVRLGERVAAARREFLEKLQPYWRDTAEALSAVRPELHYSQGWSQDSTLAAALAGSQARDLARHLTHMGPHRADVLVRLGTRPAREVLSRGQQKLVAVALILAQLRFLQHATGMRPTLLLDDPAAELDRQHLERFIHTVTQLDGQLVITALDPASHAFGTPDRMFHVEQGHVS